MLVDLRRALARNVSNRIHDSARWNPAATLGMRGRQSHAELNQKGIESERQLLPPLPESGQPLNPPLNLKRLSGASYIENAISLADLQWHCGSRGYTG